MPKVAIAAVIPLQKKLEQVLADGFKVAGIHATIETERVPTTKLVRATVVSKQFEHLRLTERQDLVWRIVDQAFKPEEQIRLSIWTLTPDQMDYGSD